MKLADIWGCNESECKFLGSLKISLTDPLPECIYVFEHPLQKLLQIYLRLIFDYEMFSSA